MHPHGVIAHLMEIGDARTCAWRLQLGLATIIVGNGLFKPNVSSLAGPLYTPDDARRNRGFTLFYMGINAGALIAPVLTSVLASRVFGTPGHESYPVVFAASGMCMLIGLMWFWFGRRKFGLGLIGNVLGSAVLMYALTSPVRQRRADSAVAAGAVLRATGHR